MNYVKTALSLTILAFDWHLLVVDTIKTELLRQAKKMVTGFPLRNS